MELYWHPLSGNSRKALLALEETGARHTLRLVDILRGEQRVPAYLRLNPNGLVPTLVDGPTVLWESSAILYYLGETHPACGLLPDTPAERAGLVRWLVWQPATFMPAIRRIRMQTVLLKPGELADPAELESAKAELARAIGIVADALGARTHMFGRYTLAEILFLPHLWWCQHDMNMDLPPGVANYVDRHGARPAWQRVLSAAGVKP